MKKLLIANRGEIAVRILRTCREMRIPTVAVYSDPDRDALHVLMADEAIHLGPAAPAESYLSFERLLAAASASGADAIHPGYGFLAENADFASAVRDAGLVWVGPDPETIELMGDKIAARSTAEAAGVLPVPGATLDPGDEDGARQADRVGYPIMVKAAGGGGGKGMRIVDDPDELASALRQARGEAGRAFADERVYLERAIVRPRHVEVQVVGDGRGRVAVLGERDCSIQRRHQKLVEESASTGLDEEGRRRLHDQAAALSEQVDYRGAGTVEFLLTPEGETFFLEMNTRIQVEHPVTEMVTGVDLVREQIRIARGEPLTLPPRPEGIRGHAIECRVGAEDPSRGFVPASGTLYRVREPGGPGIRIDSGVYQGFTVGLDYDPLMAKLVAWGRDRDQAIARMARALEEYRIYGVASTLPFHRFVMADETFRAGDVSTAFIEERLGPDPFQPSDFTARLAAVAAALDRHAGASEVHYARRSADGAWWRSALPGARS